MITSTGNAQVKQLLQLQKKSKERNARGVFLAEGLKMYGEAPEERIEKVYLAESLYRKSKETLRLEGIPHEVLSDSVFAHVSDTKTPQGILCIVRRNERTLEEVISGEALSGAEPHLLVLDNLQDPGNLGTIVRTAEGAGVTGIILSKDCVDIYNPKTIRSTMGSVYRMPFIYAEDLNEIFPLLRERGIRTYAAHLQGKNSYDKEDYSGGTAFLIGNEGNGLREEIAEQADVWVRIPMAGQVESLNAAIAASVLMFEAARQRRG